MNISLIEHSSCTGCGVCSVICPREAIMMTQEHDGFFYPKVSEQCIQCGKCLKYCHTENQNNIWKESVLLAGHYEDSDKLASCSSGGAASAISEKAIMNGGCVYGVVFSPDNSSALYKCATEKEEIEKFKGSKYIQAKQPDYKSIKEKLDNGFEVVFFGLPCLVDALHTYLGHSYDNLLLVSLVCHGPTSSLILEKYIEELNRPNNRIIELKFRYKKNGFSRPSRVLIRRERGQEIKPFITSSFGMAFELLNRESCSKCHSKYPNGAADIIIGDFWGGKDKDSKQSEYGESMIIVRNPKKQKFVNELRNIGFVVEKADWDHLEIKNPALFSSSESSRRRMQFVDDINKMPLAKAVKRNVSIKERAKNNIYYIARTLIPNTLWQKIR